MFNSNDPFAIEKSLRLLGINEINEDSNIVMDEISKYIFDTSSSSIKGEKTFDLNYDYKYYFVDFFRLGVNLNKQDIDWWEFNSLLEGIMLDENSTISRVMNYRLYKKPSKSAKTQEMQEHKFRMEMKRKYSLPNIQYKSNGFNKLWNYLEQKVGDK